MDTFIEIGPAGHPFTLKEVTETVPFGPFPQFTLIEFVPCPDEIVPPVTVHEKELPLDGDTLYVTVEFGQTGFGPVMEVGPVNGSTCIV